MSTLPTSHDHDPKNLLKSDIISKHDQADAQHNEEGEKPLVNCKGKEHGHQLMHDVKDVSTVEDVTSLSGQDEECGHFPVDRGFASSAERESLIVLSSAAACSNVPGRLDLQGSNLHPLEVVGVRVLQREDGKQGQGVQDAVMNNIILASGNESKKEVSFVEVGITGTPPESWIGLKISVTVSETPESPAAELTALSSTWWMIIDKWEERLEVLVYMWLTVCFGLQGVKYECVGMILCGKGV